MSKRNIGRLFNNSLPGFFPFFLCFLCDFAVKNLCVFQTTRPIHTNTRSQLPGKVLAPPFFSFFFFLVSGSVSFCFSCFSVPCETFCFWFVREFSSSVYLSKVALQHTGISRCQHAFLPVQADLCRPSVGSLPWPSFNRIDSSHC